MKLQVSNTQYQSLQSGFTLIELLLVLSITSLLLGLVTFNLIGARNTTSLATQEESLIANIKSQQIKAMNGIQGGGSYGVHFITGDCHTLISCYILFQGTSFLTATTTSPVSIDDSISFTCTSCSGGDVVFAKTSGETTPVSITVSSTVSSQTKTVTLNRLGVATVE